jgi:DinB family protein
VADADRTPTAKTILMDQFVASARQILKALSGIRDEEFFWEPVPGCWTVHDRSEPRARSADGCGPWVIDYEIPAPDPAPLTTIARRAVHVGAVNRLYWDYAFGPATASFDLELPGNAREATEWLAAGHAPLIESLSQVGDDRLGALAVGSA